MNRTRWKMMIGALGLSLGGLAAVAGVPASQGMVSCAGTPTHTVARVGDPPVPVPAPKVADLPPPVPTIPAPLSIPPISSEPAVIPAAAPLPPIILTPVAPATPEPVKAAPATPPAVPHIPSLPPATPIPTPTLPRLELPPAPAAPAPVPPASVPFEVNVPGGTSGVLRLAPPAPDVPSPKPVELPKPSAPEPRPAAAPVPTAPPAEERLAPTPVAPAEMKPVEKKLKVILSMGDERPRFEVRDGDEIYLKVVCDKVEVKSPGEGGVSVSTMRATGKVTFVTPGGEGTCDELAVLPGTGQVVVTGKVSFTYNWGKVETTVTGEKMNFRLGSNTVQPATGGATAIPASFTRTR